MADQDADLWIFGYGSLMWRPDFLFAARHSATLYGFHRALCIRSLVYRGTEAQPGLVFGLDEGGTCEGVAFRIAPADAATVLEAVRLRELVTNAYREVMQPVRLVGGRIVAAVAYAADPTHPQYEGLVPLDRIARVVHSARGIAGTNLDYVLNTREHLGDLGIVDEGLETVWAALAASAST